MSKDFEIGSDYVFPNDMYYIYYSPGDKKNKVYRILNNTIIGKLELDVIIKYNKASIYGSRLHHEAFLGPFNSMIQCKIFLYTMKHKDCIGFKNKYQNRYDKISKDIPSYDDREFAAEYESKVGEGKKINKWLDKTSRKYPEYFI